MPGQAHRSDPRILGRRTLEKDHRRLAALLRPGMSVLDVGCGTGSITAGIAIAVGPSGFVLGLDRDQELLEQASQAYGAIPNLRFAHGDATRLEYTAEFDCVTAARTLQWIGEPGLAIAQMKRAAKPGAVLVILDYNHAANAWDPAPPPEFDRFHRAFLDWREAHRWDNRMADHVPGLLQAAGMNHIESSVQDEIATRGAHRFSERAAIWLEVMESLGQQVAGDGFCTPGDVQAAHAAYRAYLETALISLRLSMRAITGQVPA